MNDSEAEAWNAVLANLEKFSEEEKERLIQFWKERLAYVNPLDSIGSSFLIEDKEAERWRNS